MSGTEYMGVAETARYLGWKGPGSHTGPHPRTVSDWCASGELPAIQRTRPNGRYWIRKTDADQFMTRFQTTAVTA